MTTLERFKKPVGMLVYQAFIIHLQATNAMDHGVGVSWWIGTLCGASLLPYLHWKENSKAWFKGIDVAAFWGLMSLTTYSVLSQRWGALSIDAWGPAVFLLLAVTAGAIYRRTV